LGPEDRFSLSRSGSMVGHRSRGLWSITEATRLGANRWVGALEADLGGTEMEAALVSTCALANGGGTERFGRFAAGRAGRRLPTRP
jgi:Ca-activated chloride channel homolog